MCMGLDTVCMGLDTVCMGLAYCVYGTRYCVYSKHCVFVIIVDLSCFILRLTGQVSGHLGPHTEMQRKGIFTMYMYNTEGSIRLFRTYL